VSVYDGVVLEDAVFCGPSVVFTNVTTPRASIDRRQEYRETVVRKGATLGANSTIVCGVEIGKKALIGAGAVVTADVAPHALMTGVPARRVGWVCDCGTRLSGSDQLSCGRCGLRFVLASDSIKRISDQ
jgi:UDP-2-acetamido-3-amino-2,3-dideoxy-glucuronate N-acetyltransferase